LSDDDDLRFIENLLRSWQVLQESEKPKLSILGGGVSNLVVKVESASGTWVVKTSLDKLRVKEDWFADRNRIRRETSCLRIISNQIGPEFAPKVLFEDFSNFACLLEYAPDPTVTWKQDLLSGKLDSRVFERVALFLARFHRETRDSPKVREEFWDISNFKQLRISPYIDSISARHPDLRTQFDEIISGLSSIQICLVHGDFSPKNILLLPDDRIWIIDCEVAHFGNPAFDIAFCSNHLLLKSIHLKSEDLLEEAKTFWHEYSRESGWSKQEKFAVRVLAALMLARVDGKSPVEYLDETNRQIVRKLSCELIERRVDNIEELASSVGKTIH